MQRAVTAKRAAASGRDPVAPKRLLKDYELETQYGICRHTDSFLTGPLSLPSLALQPFGERNHVRTLLHAGGFQDKRLDLLHGFAQPPGVK